MISLSFISRRNNRQTRRQTPDSTADRRRDGFSLVEVIVAMTIFAVIMAGLGGLTLQLQVQSAAGVAIAERSAAMTEKVNQLTAVPFDSLPGRSGCTHVDEPPFPRQECVTVVNMSSRVTRVTLVIAPDDPAFKADTIRIDRSKRPPNNPFNTP